VLEQENRLRHVDIRGLQRSALVLALDLLDYFYVLRRDILKFWLDEVVEVDQRDDVCLLVRGLFHPLLQEPMYERQYRSGSPRED